MHPKCRVPFAKFSYWSKHHVYIITDPGVIIIFVYNRFDQKSRNSKYLRLSFA